MRIAILASASMAVAVAVTLFDATPADAKGSHGVAVRKVQRATITKTTTQSHVLKHMRRVQKLHVAKSVATGAGAAALVKKGGSNPSPITTTHGLGKLTIHKAVADGATFRGRLAVPHNMKPKLTLMKAPKAQLSHRLSPFVQRHWKKAFFWVAVAGIGYLTIPELYYDRFVTYVDADDYDGGIRLLSQAAFEEEDEIVRVRKPMPVSATYRYSAKVAPEAASAKTCGFDRFVERSWGRPYSWVQIPQVGNVTVPEDFYDRFVGYVGAQPANYPAACEVLVEAAAADTVAMTAPEIGSSEAPRQNM